MFKQIKNITVGLSLASLLFFATSCETTKLEILDNPNALNESSADIDLFLNAIQINSSTFFEQVTEEGMEVTRILHMFGPTYDNAYGPSQLNNAYGTAYSSILADIRSMEPAAQENQLYTHVGIANVIEAYVIGTLVDYLGDIPYSEAILGSEATSPKLDSGVDIYTSVIALLDKAIIEFNKNERALPANDFYYNGDESKWIKLANTLKLKFLLQTRLVNNSVASQIDAIIASGNYIQSTDEDFQFQYSTLDANPDSRHPIFARNFDVAADVSDYMSNSFMYYLHSQKSERDPRTPYYFYRQSLDFTSDPNEASCIVESRPSHYTGDYPFCDSGNGFWGRDHGDNDGIPPDGGERTTWGIYPIGGKFDDNSGTSVSGRTIGLKGAGISPIMLASYVDFMLAESALELGTMGDARVYLENGVRKSINKVMDFGATEADPTNIPTNIDAYVTEVLDLYDNSSDKLEVVVKEYFIALYGNGVEAYNTYRRTGKPVDLQPTKLQSSASFQNSFLYPSNLVDRNANVTQKDSQGQKVFWAEGGPTVD